MPEPISESNLAPTRTNWKNIFIDWIGVPLLGSIVITLTYATNELIEGDYLDFIESMMISFTFWSVLANGNGIIVNYLEQRWSWLESPIKRLAIGIGALLIYTIIASTLIIYAYVEFYLGYSFADFSNDEQFLEFLFIPVIITIFIALWMHGRAFLQDWRQSAIDVERLKTENLKSRFESLRNQVNPHFLFNSLNALSSLVYANQEKAVDFIQKLSEVYRYVLDHQNDEVVNLKDELNFLKSFVFLNKIRFGDNFKVDYQNLQELEDWSIPPVSLQLLVENCIKHNEISKENQLKVSIRMENDAIIVENNLNPMKSPKKDSNGLGLSNIRSRYEILSNVKVQVEQSSTTFCVKIPLLNFEG
jgi:sensor histidine kinase YesM